jgi:hypothetical protein
MMTVLALGQAGGRARETSRAQRNAQTVKKKSMLGSRLIKLSRTQRDPVSHTKDDGERNILRKTHSVSTETTAEKI